MSKSEHVDYYTLYELWRATLDRAIHDVRGQAFLRKLRTVLDAMPVKRLITAQIMNQDGEVSILGSVEPLDEVDLYDTEAVAQHFGIAPAMAAELVYLNDECSPVLGETPEERWTRMRAWVVEHIYD